MTSPADEHPPSAHSSESDSKQQLDATHTVSSSSTVPGGSIAGGSVGGSGGGGGGGGGGSASSRKRASRAGTRSVNTLSAAQLERKRANDREAQRAIRQRTKEHIEKLERKIADLTANNESGDQLMNTLKRNKELEDENARLRQSLEQAQFALGVSESPGATSWGSGSHISHDQMRMASQHQVQPGISTAAAQAPQWRTANPFAGSPTVTRGPTDQSFTRPQVDPSPTDPNAQWRSYSRARAESTPTTDFKSTNTVPSQPHPMDYSYILGSAGHAAATGQAGPGRTHSQPTLYNQPGLPDSHDQQMRQFNEHLGSNNMGMSQYGPPASQQSHQHQQHQQHHQPQRHQSMYNMQPPQTHQHQPHQQQSPQHAQPPPPPPPQQQQHHRASTGRVDASPTAANPQQHQQQMFYGPYSR
ncbi:MAG: hypothetical protein M1831_007205 [Alyxoria varia]|nr:MAG: hypothetical protein M1831_007205 [Alyxoria varia]